MTLCKYYLECREANAKVLARVRRYANRGRQPLQNFLREFLRFADDLTLWPQELLLLPKDKSTQEDRERHEEAHAYAQRRQRRLRIREQQERHLTPHIF